MVPSSDSESPHLLLGRLRFLSEAIGCLIRAEPLPAALGYVPCEVQYKLCKDPSAQASASASGRSLLSVWESPSKAAGGAGPGIRKSPGRATIEVRKGSCIRASGEEYCNGHGLWVKLTRVRDKAWLSRAPFGPEETGGSKPFRSCVSSGWILIAKSENFSIEGAQRHSRVII